jgi:hypothetical protein
MMRRINLAFLFFSLFFGVATLGISEERTFKVTFYCSCAKCCGKYSPSKGGAGLTARGNQPLPFRTVAVGDPALLGKWIYFEDLGGWTLASDTGAKCLSISGLNVITNMLRIRKPTKKPAAGAAPGCVATNQVDVFVGGPNMHRRALELGVQEWKGRINE